MKNDVRLKARCRLFRLKGATAILVARSLWKVIWFMVFSVVVGFQWTTFVVDGFFLSTSSSSSNQQQQYWQERRREWGNVRCPCRKKIYISERSTQLFGKSVQVVQEPWFPLPTKSLTPNNDYANERQLIEEKAVQLAARLIQRRLDERRQLPLDESGLPAYLGIGNTTNARVKSLVDNRFMDLSCTEEGESVLEVLFTGPEIENETNDNVIRAAIMVVQSLCVFAAQVGVKGTPEQLRKFVSHLDPRRNSSLIERDLLVTWDSDSVRRLKYRSDRVAAVQLLAVLSWKRTPQGAFDLLVAIGAWEPHEDVALLRSGFPLRFSKEEIRAAETQIDAQKRDYLDPEHLLGIRKDLRHLKVYTIDGVSASEIDDGLSVEKIRNNNSEEISYRLWVHIADAERFAPPGSVLFDVGRKRITSLYLPRGSISMFPPSISNELMSLRPKEDAYALSLGVHIKPDGSIDESSIEIVPSRIRVTYRLTYEEVNEMLEEGIAYSEEWALGVWLDVANTRRQFRIRNGSSEGLIPNPIPYSTITTYPDKNTVDGIGISVKVEVSHNAGRNQTLENGLSTLSSNRVLENSVPASASFLLVTEAMILAGEALGRWKRIVERQADSKTTAKTKIPNRLRLPFRTQPAPDYRSRAAEKRMMNSLLEFNVGDGLCYSWYARRFLLPVKVTEIPLPHSGLGLDYYVQWTSPIRRFSDLQVHSAIKRFLRRNRLNELIENGLPIPQNLKPLDFGLALLEWGENRTVHPICTEDDLDLDLNYFEGTGLVAASRILLKQSQQYWLFQYVERLFKRNPDHTFQAVILGCVDPEKQQYAIYVYELGLEHRYLSVGQLDPGTKLRLKVQSVYPRNGLLTFVRVF